MVCAIVPTDFKATMASTSLQEGAEKDPVTLKSDLNFPFLGDECAVGTRNIRNSFVPSPGPKNPTLGGEGLDFW